MQGVNDMHFAAWQDDGADQISTTRDDLKLVIRKFDRCARYLVLEHAPGAGAAPGRILASGTAEDVGAAIRAANQSAIRASSVLYARRHKALRQ